MIFTYHPIGAAWQDHQVVLLYVPIEHGTHVGMPSIVVFSSPTLHVSCCGVRLRLLHTD